MSNPLLYRRLYRSLLRASKPFSSPSPRAAVVSCLLHRTGIDEDLEWETLLAVKEEEDASFATHQRSRGARPVEEARDLSRSYAETLMKEETEESMRRESLSRRREPHVVLFRKLLREVIAGIDGKRQMQFPKQVDLGAIPTIIAREFRSSDMSQFDLEARKQVAFMVLRELNRKLVRVKELEYFNDMANKSDLLLEFWNQKQAAKYVSPLPPDPKEYLRPGSFLLAHPLLTGYFRRTVICILDHTERSSKSNGGTYGLIVNRESLSYQTGLQQTLSDVLRTIPPQLADSFGGCVVRDGGPVHMSLQMIYAAPSGDARIEEDFIGGTVLQEITVDPDSSLSLHSDQAIYYQGDIVKAARAVQKGHLDRDNVSFYAGASCWEVGQLESEVNRGFWLPCRGPPSMALTGKCEHDYEHPNKEDDLWLSMMCSMGNDEGILAHLMHDDHYIPNGEPCDSSL